MTDEQIRAAMHEKSTGIICEGSYRHEHVTIDDAVAVYARMVEKAVAADRDKLRRAIAEILGQDAERWPEHGKSQLAIAASMTLWKKRAEASKAARDALAEVLIAILGQEAAFQGDLRRQAHQILDTYVPEWRSK